MENKRVLLKKGHSWGNHSGTIVGIMKTPIGEMYKVKLDNGTECGAKKEFIIFID